MLIPVVLSTQHILLIIHLFLGWHKGNLEFENLTLRCICHGWIEIKRGYKHIFWGTDVKFPEYLSQDRTKTMLPGLGLWCLTSLSTLSVISWRSVLLVKVTVEPGEKLRPVASH